MKRTGTLPAGFVAIWSSGYVVGSIAAHNAPALAITFWRLRLAGLLLVGLTRVGSRGSSCSLIWPSGVRAFGGVALLGALLFGVQFGGVYLGMAEGMPAGTVSLAISCCPLLVAGTQAVLGLERLAAVQLLWTVLGVAGFAAGTLLTPRLVPVGVDPRAVAAIECLSACVVVAPWALLTGGLEVPATLGAYGSAAWLTGVNAIGGPLILLALVRQRGATRASSLLFVVPATTAILAWVVLGQSIAVTTLAGLVVAGTGVALLEGHRRPGLRLATGVAREPVASTMDG